MGLGREESWDGLGGGVMDGWDRCRREEGMGMVWEGCWDGSGWEGMKGWDM